MQQHRLVPCRRLAVQKKTSRAGDRKARIEGFSMLSPPVKISPCPGVWGGIPSRAQYDKYPGFICTSTRALLLRERERERRVARKRRTKTAVRGAAF